jgi:acetylornithine/N-succinyldiaminopimelate aminotransferase
MQAERWADRRGDTPHTTTHNYTQLHATNDCYFFTTIRTEFMSTDTASTLALTSEASIFEREQHVMFQTYRRVSVAVSHGEGCYLYDESGKRYLDFLSGIAVNALGYNHAKLNDAIVRQVQSYLHVSNVFYQEPQVRLAELIIATTGYQRVFFSNSGAEALEGTLKLVKHWGNDAAKRTGNPADAKTELLAFKGGFHGRTYGALSLMDKPLYKDGMGPFLPNTRVLPFNDSAALREAVNERTCAVALEFLQGEGGIVFAEPDFVNTILELKEQFDFLLIADEVQAGVGRTGKFFSFDHFMVKPDVVVMAKAIGGGLPLGLILGGENVASVWDKGQHGTTFGGNPVACAAGEVVMKEVTSTMQQNAHETGCYLRENLSVLQQEFPAIVEEVRGCGLMAGLKLSSPAAPFVAALLERGVIVNATAETVIRILPPLIATRKEVDIFANAMRDVFLASQAQA